MTPTPHSKTRVRDPETRPEEESIMNETDRSPENVLDLFGDDLVRRILLLTSDVPMSVAALADELDISRPTVHRRVNDLVAYGILHEGIELDSEGRHYRTFEPALNEITFRLEDGQLRIGVEMNESLVRFDGVLSGLGAIYSPPNVDSNERSETTPSWGDPHYG